jgi:hypothetical protein
MVKQLCCLGKRLYETSTEINGSLACDKSPLIYDSVKSNKQNTLLMGNLISLFDDFLAKQKKGGDKELVVLL